MTSTLLDQIITHALFYKFGHLIADRVILDRVTSQVDNLENVETDNNERVADVPPFSEKVPVAGD